MNKQTLGKTNLKVSRVALGMMRLSSKNLEETKTIIKTALDAGINFFDHADIYGRGKSEELFGQAMKDLKIDRSTIYIQSKCGIDPRIPMYNFSKEYILKSVDEILERLQTDYLDLLLLHRPDMLMDPLEINEAFKILHEKNKVRHFGVSNMNKQQLSFLQKHLDIKIEVNQLQFSIMHNDLVRTSIYTNMNELEPLSNSFELLDYMQEHDISMQAWSPFNYGLFEGIFIDNDKFPILNEKLAEIALKYNAEKSAIAVAWINTHPAKIQTIIGTMTPKRIIDASLGANIILTRQEWYEIYKAAGFKLP